MARIWTAKYAPREVARAYRHLYGQQIDLRLWYNTYPYWRIDDDGVEAVL